MQLVGGAAARTRRLAHRVQLRAQRREPAKELIHSLSSMGDLLCETRRFDGEVHVVEVDADPDEHAGFHGGGVVGVAAQVPLGLALVPHERCRHALVGIGTLIAERAKAQGVTSVAFDRSGFKYHGRVKALADAAREGGQEF